MTSKHVSRMASEEGVEEICSSMSARRVVGFAEGDKERKAERIDFAVVPAAEGSCLRESIERK